MTHTPRGSALTRPLPVQWPLLLLLQSFEHAPRALRDRARTDPMLATRPLLRVSLSDARALLRCVDFDARALLEQLFRVHWCWRPEGLRESKEDKTKTVDGQDVCVWGFRVPEAPPLCRDIGK